MRGKKIFFLLSLVLFTCSLMAQSGSYRTCIFLHHSTGQNIYGPNGSSTSIPDEAVKYNNSHGYTGDDAVSIDETWYPSGDNEWSTWHRIFNAESAVDDISPYLNSYKIVMIKSCFPSSNIYSAGSPADTNNPDDKTLFNYKWHWRNIINKMKSYPDIFFVISTNAPLVSGQTNALEASLSDWFCTWAKDTLAKELDSEFGTFPKNVYVFDFFHKLADASGFLPSSLASALDDSHPNAAATALVAPQVVKEVFDAAINFENSANSNTVLVDFGATAEANVFGLSGWNTVIKSPGVNYTSSGPGGLVPVPEAEEFTDYEGVQGSARIFQKGERIVVTWYNNSDETFIFTSRISFRDSDQPEGGSSFGNWYTMRRFSDYRYTFTEIAPHTSTKTVFNITDSGVHKSDSSYSLINVNLAIEWGATWPKQYLVCDKIELYTDADITAPSQPTGLVAAPISDSKIQLNWNQPSDNVGVVEYLIYNNGEVEGYSRTNNYTCVLLETGTTYNFTVSARDAAGNESLLSSSVSTSTQEYKGDGTLVNPEGLNYLGAFKLPDDFLWGGEAIEYNPNGDGGQSGSGSTDGFPGSVFATNLNQPENGLVGELSIPAPIVSAGKNPDEIPTATILQSAVNIRPTNINSWEYVDIWRTGLEYVPDEGRLYSSWSIHYTVTGDKHASISCCDATNLSSATKYGAWFAGSTSAPNDATINDWLFSTPQSWANTFTSGRNLVVGRCRDGGLSGLGPTMYAFSKVGVTPPAAESQLELTTLLQYGPVEGTDNYNFPNSVDGYKHSDNWREATWISSLDQNSVAVIGNKALGNNWYGYVGERMLHDWVIADTPYPDFYVTDPDGKGWKGHNMQPMIIFYNPSNLAQVAAGTIQSYDPQPYAAFRINKNLFFGPEHEIFSATFDSQNKILYIAEFVRDPDGRLIIHAWQVESIPVPVELASFNANVTDSRIILNWITSTETNNLGFEIEHRSSTLTKNWKKIGFISGKGNSTEPAEYNFEDKNPDPGINQYRFKQIDYDGTFEYSGIVEAEINKPARFEVFQNYPNPFNAGTKINFILPNSGYVKIQVYNSVGEEVVQLFEGMKPAGYHEIYLDASGLSSGLYLLIVKVNENNSKIFSETKKIILLR
ncbi:MAG: T9SS C-terminal target domain-containing protein [Ignavibacteriales bacterium]|nr:MAG: T9SS C-terminal target domain-containing protein [Ignavibacteriales bacterium]